MWTLFKCLNLVTFFPCSLKERLDKIFFKIHKGLGKKSSNWILIKVCLQYETLSAYLNMYIKDLSEILHTSFLMHKQLSAHRFYFRKKNRDEFLKSYLNFSHLIKIPYIDILHWRHQEINLCFRNLTSLCFYFNTICAISQYRLLK